MRKRERFRCFVCRRVYTLPLYPAGLAYDMEQACHECSDVVREEAIEDAITYRQAQAVINAAVGGVPAGLEL